MRPPAGDADSRSDAGGEGGARQYEEENNTVADCSPNAHQSVNAGEEEAEEEYVGGDKVWVSGCRRP